MSMQSCELCYHCKHAKNLWGYFPIMVRGYKMSKSQFPHEWLHHRIGFNTGGSRPHAIPHFICNSCMTKSRTSMGGLTPENNVWFFLWHVPIKRLVVQLWYFVFSGLFTDSIKHIQYACMVPCTSSWIYTTGTDNIPGRSGRTRGKLVFLSFVCYSLLYCPVLSCTVLCCTLLYCCVVYCTVLYYPSLVHHNVPLLWTLLAGVSS